MKLLTIEEQSISNKSKLDKETTKDIDKVKKELNPNERQRRSKNKTRRR